MSNLYPIYLNIKDKLCLVVGGGQVAERKIGSLLECGARVKVVSPEVTTTIKNWAAEGKLELLAKEYQTSDLEKTFLVFAATSNERVNNRVAEECLGRQIAINVADQPQKCDFIVPSVIRRGKLTIAVSTSGASPKLAAKIRQQLEEQFGPEYQEFLELLSDIRSEILSEVKDINQRQKIFSHLVDSDILDLLKAKKYDQVKERINNAYRGNWR